MKSLSHLTKVSLYIHPQSVEEKLKALGFGNGTELTSDQVAPFDQMHYDGNDTVLHAAAKLGLGPKSRVLDVGSGFGGPARCLARNFGCHVTALELQNPIHSVAVDLTERSGLSDLVTHVCADALEYPLQESSFDAVVSWLAIAHIPDRSGLFKRLVGALRPGGGCYIEGCIRQESATEENAHLLDEFLTT
jgi:cyclopropane fatty-acyl-phospholipid synthase-like methyltransferase